MLSNYFNSFDLARILAMENPELYVERLSYANNEGEYCGDIFALDVNDLTVFFSFEGQAEDAKEAILNHFK